MNHTKKICCGMAALMLCIGCLTGCGANTQETAETASSSSSAAESSETAETTQTARSEAEQAASESDAKAALTQFLEGCKNSDTDAILSVADYRGLQQALDGDAFDETQFQEDLRAMLCDGFESYTIGEVTRSAEDLADFNEMTGQFREALSEDSEEPEDADTQRCIDYLLTLMQPADDRCVYAVTVTTDGTDSTDEIALLRYGDAWQLDLVSQAAQAILSRDAESGGTE